MRQRARAEIVAYKFPCFFLSYVQCTQLFRVLMLVNCILELCKYILQMQSTARLGHEFGFFVFFRCIICIHVHVCFVLLWTVESFPFMFWRWRNKLK